MYHKWEFKIFSVSCIFLHISEICIVEMEKKSFKNKPEELLQPQEKRKLSSILDRCATHVWEEVDIFIETSSTAVTCFYFQNLNESYWINTLLQRLCLIVLTIH